MSNMMDILKKVDGLAIAPVSKGADIQNLILRKELDFKIHKFKSGLEHNGWIVPKKWEVKKARIWKGKRLIYDGKNHPLGVIGYSKSFNGVVSLSELKDHLFYSKKHPSEIVYHCDLYYKPFRDLWGFCIPYNLYKKLTRGSYYVDLETVKTNDYLKVLEYDHKGSSKQTIILNAHNCHAAQLNDGPSGYVVGIEVMKRLKFIRTKYSYKLLIAPEHIGTVFYMSKLPRKIIETFKCCLFLEMLGNDWPNFALQQSFDGDKEIDKAAHHFLKFHNKNYWWEEYRKLVGNDENVWEAPGVEVPTISLSRCKSADFYYPQYHLNTDNIKIMNKKKLDEAVNAVLGIVDILEKNCRVKRQFNGLVALSNPKYNLYFSYPDPSSKEKVSPEQLNWNNLMNRITRYFDGRTTILEMAEIFGFPFDQVYGYLSRFVEKGLIKFVDD